MGAMTSLATLGLNLALQRQAQRAEDKRLAKDRDRQLKDIAAADAESSRLQGLTLRRRLAEERARAGAAGLGGGTGGSADAILRGLEEEGRAAQAAIDEQGARKAEAVRDAFGERRRRNLLEYSSRWLSAGSSALGGGGGTTRRSLLD